MSTDSNRQTLESNDLMEGEQRGAKSTDNFMIDKMVTQDVTDENAT